MIQGDFVSYSCAWMYIHITIFTVVSILSETTKRYSSITRSHHVELIIENHLESINYIVTQLSTLLWCNCHICKMNQINYTPQLCHESLTTLSTLQKDCSPLHLKGTFLSLINVMVTNSSFIRIPLKWQMGLLVCLRVNIVITNWRWLSCW